MNVKQLKQDDSNLGVTGRIEKTNNGVSYLVLDAIPIRVGVFNRTLFTPESISNAWMLNDKAVTLPSHPSVDQNQSQELSNTWTFGRARNSRFEIETGRVLSEYWFELSKLMGSQYSWLIEATERQVQIENSVGVLRMLERQEAGTFNGLDYDLSLIHI